MKHEEGVRSKRQDEGKVGERVQKFRIPEHSETTVSTASSDGEGFC